MTAKDAVAVGPEDALANFAVRARRPLHEFVARRLAELRRHGIRVSKAVLTEMLLWELARNDVAQLTERIKAFRHAAPRGPR